MCEAQLKLRCVEAGDVEDLYNWRNHSLARQGSFNTDPLSWDEHRRWFEEKRQSPKTTIYIAYCKQEKIGAIRFEDEYQTIRINIMLNPDHIGKGLGARCVKQGVQEVVDNNRVNKPIIAEIKNDNFASVKVFEKAGFTKDMNDNKKNHLVYALDLQEKDLWKR